MSPEPASWTAFALTRAEVARALRYPEDDAAEWLRQAAVGRRVRVRFSRYYLERHWINVRLNGYPSLSNEEEREFPRRYWFPPVDEMESPAAMKEHHIVEYTEWDAGQLRAALDAADEGKVAAIPVGLAESAKADRRGVGGRKRKYPWDELGAGFGAWLHDQPGRADLKEDDRVEALVELAGRLGCEPPGRTTAQPYLAKWLRAYRAFLRDD